MVRQIPDQEVRIVAFALLTVSGAAHADALQQQVLAGAKASGPNDFAFTQITRAERTGAPTSEIVQRYDPRRGGWSLVRIDGKPPTPKQLSDSAKRMKAARPPSYGRIVEWFGAPATRVATTPTSVTYRFARMPKGALKLGSHDASENTSVDAVVDTSGKVPFVSRARFTSLSPFRMFMVAKVERFAVLATYRLLPDGRPVPDSTNADFSGSLMGKAQSMKTRTTLSEVASTR